MSADYRVSQEELTRLYDLSYFTGREYHDYHNEEASLRENFLDRWSVLSSYIDEPNTITLLEIGCAYGYFLDFVKAHVGQVKGFDISADAVQIARSRFGVDASTSEYLDVTITPPVNVIVMWDTIEHLSRPDLYIEKAAQDLVSGGLLAITTGDVSSFNARWRGANWRMIHPPTHMHYFSPATLRKLLERHGMEVVHVSHPGNRRKINAIIYHFFAVKWKWPKVHRWLSQLPVARRDVRINLFDIMYVVAKKK